jgi:ATP-binding cassette subfamily F protein 3
MLLRPSNTLLLDEPTNHLDLDSKEVLLDALVDYGGTLIFVSHDRYFVERLATKIIEIGDGRALVYPGTYKEFLWHKQNPQAARQRPMSAPKPALPAEARSAKAGPQQNVPAKVSHERKKRDDADARKLQRAAQARRAQIDRLEAQIADCEHAIREIEQKMSAPGFYDDRAAAQPIVDRHQALMWQVGDLMHQWEQLHAGDVPTQA